MKKYFILAAAAIAMAACSNDESENIVKNDNIVKLTASIGTQTRATVDATDAQDEQFVSGKSIFVEAYKTGGTSTYTTATYTTASSGAMTGVMYYPSDNSNIDICAFYPATINSNSTSFEVGADQTTAAKYQPYDLMYATKLTNQAKLTSGSHALTFNHALSKIVVTITNGVGVSATDITSKVTAVKINNTKPTYEFTVSGGVITPNTVSASGTAADIDITGSDITSQAGIIVPQTVAAGDFITVTYNSIDYTYELGSNTTFEPGKVYTYNLTLRSAGIELSSLSITNWTSGGTESETITL